MQQRDARAKARARHHVDRFADVPVYTDNMPAAEPADDAAGAPARPSRPVTRPRQPTADRPASRPVTPSASAKRAQPSRKPRSQRGKR